MLRYSHLHQTPSIKKNSRKENLEKNFAQNLYQKIPEWDEIATISSITLTGMKSEWGYIFHSWLISNFTTACLTSQP
jgi:hypothetical protein